MLLDSNTMIRNAEDGQELPLASSKLLPGLSLLQIHLSGGKSLPKDGSKEFKPSGSWMEKKQIQTALDERKELLSVERVAKWGDLAAATWDPKKKLAEVTRRTGKHFQSLGFEIEGTLYLYSEEALYLLERNSLELSFGGVPLSIQQGYSLLLGTNTGCNIIQYRTYSHLVGQGYRLLRFSSQHGFTKYERVIRLDQHAPAKRREKFTRLSKNTDTPKAPIVSCVKSEDSTLKEPLPTESRLSQKGNQSKDTTLCDPSSPIYGSCHSNSKEPEITPEPSLMESKLTMRSSNAEGQTGLEAQGSISDEKEMELESERSDEVSKNQHQEEPSHEADNTCSEESDITYESKKKQEEKDNDDDIDSNDEDGSQSPTEGAKKEALHIAESLMSIGSVLMEKETSSIDSSKKETKKAENISATLLSEIMGVLGSHFNSTISKEALADVAAKAADTILSHVTEDSLSGEKIQESSEGLEISSTLKNLGESVENITESCKTNSNSNDHHDSDVDLIEYESTNSKIRQNLVTEKSNMPVNQTDPPPGSEAVNLKSIFPDLVKDSNSTWSSSPESSDPNCILTDSDEFEADKGSDCQVLKRPLSVDEEAHDCEPVLIKRPKILENTELEIEILDVPPKVKDVELVNLSEESSLDSVDIKEATHDRNVSIEVIDLQDSSEESSDSVAQTSATASSESDDSVIIEDRKCSWDEERKRILDTFPNMHNLGKITLQPPSPDLLPQNVRPQRSVYHITRWKLRRESKNNTPTVPHSEGLLSLPLTNQHPGMLWPQNVPVDAVAAIQTIAQLVLPMLGIMPAALPSNQVWYPPPRHPMWRPRQPMWHPPHPMWKPRAPHVNQYRPAHRPFRNRPRGRGYFYQNFSANNIPNQTQVREPTFARQFRGNNVISIASTSQTEGNLEDNGHSNWHSWLQKNQKRVRGEALRKKGFSKGACRYFCPPKKYKHMKSVLEDTEVPKENDPKSESSENEHDIKTLDVKNLEPTAHSSSSEDSNSRESLDNSDEVKPLLSPNDCENFGSVFKSLQVVKEASSESLISTVYENPLKPHFDLFSPNKPFRKGKPASPDYHLCIMGCDDAVPDPGQIRDLQIILNDGVPILFGIVSPDSINFMQFCNISLPSIF